MDPAAMMRQAAKKTLSRGLMTAMQKEDLAEISAVFFTYVLKHILALAIIVRCCAQVLDSFDRTFK